MAKLIEDELVALGYLQVGEYCALKAPMRGKKVCHCSRALGPRVSILPQR